MISLFNSCEVISEPGNLFRLSLLAWLPRMRRKNKSIPNSVREGPKSYSLFGHTKEGKRGILWCCHAIMSLSKVPTVLPAS